MDKVYMVVSAAAGLITGAILVLKVIAPKTKTLKDDKVLERLVQLEEALASVLGLLPKPPEPAKTPEKPAGPIVRDHRDSAK